MEYLTTDCNIKSYSNSKHFKSRRGSIQQKWRDTTHVNTDKDIKHQERASYKSISENYNINYINKFSTYFHKIRTEQKQASRRKKTIKKRVLAYRSEHLMHHPTSEKNFEDEKSSNLDIAKGVVVV